jgi:hypothetical protein
VRRSRAREVVGSWLHERWRTELVLRSPWLSRRIGWEWPRLANRHERPEHDPLTGGFVLPGGECSRLSVARTFPRVGGRLLEHCLARWPIALAEADAPRHGEPDLSVVIGVRGTRRLPQFNCCMASLAAQRDARVEVVVVEQSAAPEFESLVPGFVRYLHQRAPEGLPYNRSWALNAGVRAARAPVVVLHDADMVVPMDFSAAIVVAMKTGLDALRLPRFLFYLDEATSRHVQDARAFPPDLRVDTVVANNRTPVAVSREAYLAIGGHDEGYSGWGAEDDDFMDRLRTKRLGEGAFLPIVHLWHPEAPKRDAHLNQERLRRSRAMPMADRLRSLCSLPWGGSQPSAREPAKSNQDEGTRS